MITLVAVALAGLLGWAMWGVYMAAPWTRDATVRAYVVTMAPEVAGRIVELPVVEVAERRREAAERADRVTSELLAQARDIDLDRVGLAHVVHARSPI